MIRAKIRPKREFRQRIQGRKPLVQARREARTAGKDRKASPKSSSPIREYIAQSRQIEVLARKFGDEMVRRFTRRTSVNFKIASPSWDFLEERRIRRHLAWCFLGHIGGGKTGGARTALRSFVLPSENLRKLTPREQNVASGLMCGLENKEIASKMSISHETVKKHLDNMMLKANVDNRSKLLRWCLGI